MEEQRISRMYLNLFTRWFGRTWERSFPRGLMRSPLFFLSGLAALVLVPSLGWYLHLHGKFHTAKNDLGVTQAPAGPAVPRPGGAEAMVLQRTRTAGGTAPEFLSATMLPGLGMGVLQITAAVPGGKEISLLSAPTAQALSDNTQGPRSGTMDDHGSLELPWGGTVSGLISPLGTSLSTTWQGKTLSMPRDIEERTPLVEGGMLLSQAADAMQLTPTENGAMATAAFHATDFGSHWPSKTDIAVTAQLSARTLELTITAKNVGEDPEPMGIGWQPRFVIPGNDRNKVELRLPGGDVMEIAHDRAVPTGKLTAPGDSLSRFQGQTTPLGPAGLDGILAHLKPAGTDAGAAAELRDPGRGIGLRLVSESPAIRVVHVISPSGSGFVSLGMQTNYDDALSKDWNGEGIVTLAPGQSLEWKVRLEIFAVTKR